MTSPVAWRVRVVRFPFWEVTGFAAVLAVGACERYRGVKDGYKQSLCPQQMKIHVAIDRDGKVWGRIKCEGETQSGFWTCEIRGAIWASKAGCEPPFQTCESSNSRLCLGRLPVLQWIGRSLFFPDTWHTCVWVNGFRFAYVGFSERAQRFHVHLHILFHHDL